MTTLAILEITYSRVRVEACVFVYAAHVFQGRGTTDVVVSLNRHADDPSPLVAS